MTVQDQIKGLRKGTRVDATGIGRGGRTGYRLGGRVNGCVVLHDPCGDQVFVPLDDTAAAIRRA